MSKPLRLRTYLFRVFGATQALQVDFTTRNLYRLSDGQRERLTPLLPKSHGKPRVDTRRDLSRIILVNRSDFRWRDAPKEYGPAKTLYNRWKRWSDNGLFARIMVGLAASAEHKTIMIDATYLKAHRTASSLRVKKGGVRARSGEPKGSEDQETVRGTVSPENGTPSCTLFPMRRGGRSGSSCRRAKSAITQARRRC